MNLKTAKDEVSLCEAIDRLLNKGAVLTGEIVISVADIDLLYLGVNLILASVETIQKTAEAPIGRQE